MGSIHEIFATRQNIRVDRKIKVWDERFPGKTFLLPVTMYVLWKEKSGRIYFVSQYNKSFIESIKALDGAKWHGYGDGYVPSVIGTNKVWSCVVNEHNIFQLSFLDSETPNPYNRYDQKIKPDDYPTDRPLRDYQKESKAHLLVRRWAIWAEEMGLGKSLAAIDAFDYFFSQKGLWENDLYWWIAPRSALASVMLEVRKWNARFKPKFLTYDSLKKIIKEWRDGDPAPRGVVFDEAHLIKNPTSQRSEAAKHLAKSIREEWGLDSLILAMTGTPSPRTPADWWNLAHIVCPGFLKESSRVKLERRLSLIVEKENPTTKGIYPHRVTWFDDERKCAECGNFKDDPVHEYDHPWKPSKNEVDILSKRLQGLVLIKFKKDCLDLPEKQYRVITLKPKQAVLNAAKLIKAKCSTTIQALTLLRELSDGFQYEEKKTDEKQCTLCKGSGKFTHPGTEKLDIDDECPVCKGSGKEPIFTRTTIEIPSPKIDLLKDLLEEHSDVGRFVVYAGFTGSIDRIVKTCVASEWTVIKCDGRGVSSSLPGKFTDWLEAFQNKPKNLQTERIVFVGHPESGGMGLNLHASPSIFFYSNGFNGAGRSQAEDRIHRNGMDENRGATIIDCIHLPVDRLVLDNLKKKRDLELLSLGEFRNAMEQVENNFEAETLRY